MKLAPLLAQYLYTNKQLDLPGIGTFLLDASFSMEPENPKQVRPVVIEGVSFEHNAAVKETPELIQFISSHTGKIKALASADLDSHLQLARQFINIGKPFLFEGIGSIAKNQSGVFDFTPGLVSNERLKDNTAKETTHGLEEPASDYKSVLYNKKEKNSWKKPVVILLLMAGIVLAVWGGYKVYKNTIAKKKGNTEDIKKAEPQTGTVSNDVQKDSTPNDTTNSNPAPLPATATIPAGNFKFVIETAAKSRALKRFTKLKNMGLSILMETNDSTTFKLFFVIPVAISDTAHYIDSLSRTYSPPGRRTVIEN